MWQGTPVAVKHIHSALAMEPHVLALIVREALLHASIRHPNLVTLWSGVRAHVHWW